MTEFTELLLTPFRKFHLDGFHLAELFQCHLFGDALLSDALEAANQFIASIEDLPEVEITNLQEYKDRESAITQIQTKLLEESNNFPVNIRTTFKLVSMSLGDQRYYMAKNLSWIDVLNRRDRAEARKIPC
jgi:hypothetical protein